MKNTEYILLNIGGKAMAKFLPMGLNRIEAAIATPGVSMVYSDYISGDARMNVIDYQKGALRDDFDFGHVVAVKKALLPSDFTAPANQIEWYELRLMLSRKGEIVHIAEPLYSVDVTHDDKSQFDYVGPRNRDYQLTMEKICTRHLELAGALITGGIHDVDLSEGSFPVEASVIIPVKNRARTIADAVGSALSQKTGFDFNVIVIDNDSTDGTSEILDGIADPRLHIIRPAESCCPPGIGGCWNLGIFSEHCGRFAVQLDSDDVYSSELTLQKIVDEFYAQKCAMVVGSYTLTDFDLNVIPPGLIDHREWTDGNGRNNLLRVNGIGAPRAFFTPVARRVTFPDVSYGEDYAMGLAVSRNYKVGRIFDSLYFCRRWSDNSDASLDREKANRNNYYKDSVRTRELLARIAMNSHEA